VERVRRHQDDFVGVLVADPPVNRLGPPPALGDDVRTVDHDGIPAHAHSPKGSRSPATNLAAPGNFGPGLVMRGAAPPRPASMFPAPAARRPAAGSARGRRRARHPRPAAARSRGPGPGTSQVWPRRALVSAGWPAV